MSGMRVAFTGGSGKAGRYAIAHLVSLGYNVLNLDRVLCPELDKIGVPTVLTDLTDLGQVFSAMTNHFSAADLESGKPAERPGAVVHFAAVPRNFIQPDNKTFSDNITSTYNVIEVACKLGINNIVSASSETTYGVCFAEGQRDYASFPLEESYDTNPMDSYALSKVCGEKVARAFATRYSTDIYCLRIGNVTEPHEYEGFVEFVENPHLRYRNAWSYVDARDLGELAHRCIQTPNLGFQIFNATNTDSTLREPVASFLKREYPHITLTREMEEHEAPITNRKARTMLNFAPKHTWRTLI